MDDTHTTKRTTTRTFIVTQPHGQEMPCITQYENPVGRTPYNNNSTTLSRWAVVRNYIVKPTVRQLLYIACQSTLTPQLIISLKISAQRERNHHSLPSWGRTVTAGIRETNRTNVRTYQCTRR